MTQTPTLHDAKRIVIKIGSSLVAEGAALRKPWLASLTADIAALHAAGKEIILVSSGAAGQPLLIQAWQQAFDAHGIKVAQLLLTLEDSERRRRYLNARATFTTLLAHRLIPIVNENDSVATAELKFGDNDRLAARVAVMLDADTLVLFSDIDGLYTANPQIDKTAKHIPLVSDITPEITAMAGGAASSLRNGGMKTKIDAAQMAMNGGCHMVIARGTDDHALVMSRSMRAPPKHCMMEKVCCPQV